MQNEMAPKFNGEVGVCAYNSYNEGVFKDSDRLLSEARTIDIWVEKLVPVFNCLLIIRWYKYHTYILHTNTGTVKYDCYVGIRITPMTKQ